MPSDIERPFPENYLFRHGPTVTYLIIIGILADNLLNLGYLSEIQWPHIVLIAGLLLIPFLREIDQVFIPNVGGFQMNQTLEWKQTMQEILEETDFESASPDEFDDETGNGGVSSNGEPNGENGGVTHDSREVDKLGGNVDEIADEIYGLADENPRLAISRLGMELEHGIKHLIDAKGGTPAVQFNEMLHQLRDDPSIDSRFIGIAEEVRHARNEAVHSAKFDSDNMVGLIDVGLDLLRYINKSTPSQKIPQDDPIETY